MLVSLVGPCCVCLGHERLATTENPPNDFLRSFDDNEDQDGKHWNRQGGTIQEATICFDRLSWPWFSSLPAVRALLACVRAIVVVILNHAAGSISYEKLSTTHGHLTKIFR